MPASLSGEKIQGIGENAIVKKWSFDGAGQTGEAVQAASFSDRSIQAAGTFGGTTITIEGSNNSTNGTDGDWVTLTDTAGTALTFTSAGLKQILQVTRFVRAKTTAGTGVAVTATMVAVRKGL